MKLVEKFCFIAFTLFVLISGNAQSTNIFIEGKCNSGYGKMDYKSGAQYLGNFICGLRDGLGRLTYANGDVYYGLFTKDLRNGFEGKFTFVNGDIFEGRFINDVGTGKLKDVFKNEIPGKLEANNRFVEDRIAYGNMVAKLKKSMVVLDTFQAENESFLSYDAITGFIISNDKLCIPNYSFYNRNFITANLRFSDGKIRRNIRLNKISQFPDRGIAIFQFQDFVLPSFTLPLGLETKEPIVNTKVIAIGGPNLNDDEGTILSYDPPQDARLGQIAPYFTGKMSPLFDRSGHFIGFAIYSERSTAYIFTVSDFIQLQTAIGN